MDMHSFYFWLAEKFNTSGLDIVVQSWTATHAHVGMDFSILVMFTSSRSVS